MAIALPSPVQAPVAAASTIQHCPTAGLAGGVASGPASIAAWTSASSKVSASLCVTSFCACAKRSEEHTSELQSLMRNSYAGFCLKKKNHNNTNNTAYKK